MPNDGDSFCRTGGTSLSVLGVIATKEKNSNNEWMKIMQPLEAVYDVRKGIKVFVNGRRLNGEHSSTLYVAANHKSCVEKESLCGIF